MFNDQQVCFFETHVTFVPDYRISHLRRQYLCNYHCQYLISKKFRQSCLKKKVVQNLHTQIMVVGSLPLLYHMLKYSQYQNNSACEILES